MPISPEPHQDGATLRPDFSSAALGLDGPRLPALAEDRHLFPLLATLARHAGRADLEDEFLRRATSSWPEVTGNLSKTPGAVPADQEKEARELARRGLRLLNAEKLDEALGVLRQAIRLNPHAEEPHGNLGVTLARLGRPAEAEAAFRVALQFNPTSSAMYSNLGTTCLQQNQPVEAERAFRQALHFKPEDAEVHRHLGGTLEARNLLEAAEAEYRESLRLNPALAETHSRLAGLCRRRDKPKEAEASYREAVRLRPDNVGDWNNLGGVLESLGRNGDSEAAYREASRLAPDNPDFLNNIGVALAAQGRQEEAASIYRQALALKPNLSLAHNNLGNALRALGHLDEAATHLEEAKKLSPRYAEAHNNLGIVRVQQGQTAQGLVLYDEALRLRPDYPEAHLNRALVLLGDGDYGRGWSEYEWRWKMRHSAQPKFGVPRWDGSPLNGRTLLLHCEQGLGDTLQFIRYAALVPRGSGGRIVLDCPAVLATLLKTCPGIDVVVPRNDKLPTVDLYIHLLSIPGLVGTTLETIPAPIPYLTVDPERVRFWRDELNALDGFRVGIVWQGSKQHKGDRQRSVPLAQFAPLAAVPGVKLCSLQKGDGSEQIAEGLATGILSVELGARTSADFSDVAALLTVLDLVVTVDTAVAHAAGALGVPIWVGVSFAADWRWLRGREDTPWYPTMRLFRQSTPGDWPPVFARLAEALRIQVEKREPTRLALPGS